MLNSRLTVSMARRFVSTIGELTNKVASRINDVFALTNMLQRSCNLIMLMLTKELPSYSLSSTNRDQLLKKPFTINGLIIILNRFRFLRFLLMYL